MLGFPVGRPSGGCATTEKTQSEIHSHHLPYYMAGNLVAPGVGPTGWRLAVFHNYYLTVLATLDFLLNVPLRVSSV